MKPEITVKEFYENTFNLDFMSEEEKQTIFTATELYAKGYAKAACKEQREICSNTGKHQKFGLYQYKKDQMINAPEPELL